MLEAGADKISVNSAALARPALIEELARSLGSQAVVVAIDTEGGHVRSHSATRDAERDKKFYSEAIGCHCPRFEGVPEVWIAYLAVDEVDARVNKAQALALN